MDAARREQVTHVVHFMGIAPLETLRLVMSDVRRNVAICILRLANDLYPFIHLPIELRILVEIVDVGHGLDPLVVVTITPRAAMLMLLD